MGSNPGRNFLAIFDPGFPQKIHRHTIKINNYNMESVRKL